MCLLFGIFFLSLNTGHNAWLSMMQAYNCKHKYTQSLKVKHKRTQILKVKHKRTNQKQPKDKTNSYMIDTNTTRHICYFTITRHDRYTTSHLRYFTIKWHDRHLHHMLSLLLHRYQPCKQSQNDFNFRKCILHNPNVVETALNKKYDWQTCHINVFIDLLQKVNTTQGL